jgi:hypothetical protein
LDKLDGIGLEVRLLVADQGTNNQSLFRNHLMVTKEKPYIEQNGRKIFTMFDSPHLLKSVRNNLEKHDFVLDGKRISWEHLRKFFEYDIANVSEIRLAPKLSHNHIYTPPLRHMKVKYATQIFSHTVYAALNACASASDCPVSKDACDTADFVKNNGQTL